MDRVSRQSRSTLPDNIAIEEPLEIRLDEQSVAVVMRTPGNDKELAAGFLRTESIVSSYDEIESIEHKEDPDNPNLANIVNIVTKTKIDIKKHGWQRNFVSASSCGLCGKLTIESVRLEVPSVRNDKLRLTPAVLRELPKKMRGEQIGFDQTGGIHAAGLFDASGNLLIVREDIGRHNAVDKVVGAAMLSNKLPLTNHVLMVSGRASFEIVQKALMVRIPIVAAVSAASSLAVELAAACNMGLIGFLRDDTLNVYTGLDRVAEDKKSL